MIKDVKVKQFHSRKVVVVWSLIFREKDANVSGSVFLSQVHQP